MAVNPWGKWAKTLRALNWRTAGTQFLNAGIAPGTAKSTSARVGDTIVFVEVKARAGDAYGGGGAAVTPCKQQRVVRMAIDFLARPGLLDRPCRLRPRIEVYAHAFTA